jgi:predicted nucleic-acid-binding protein
MTGVDTSILVRIITDDHKKQAARATAFLRQQDQVFLAKTVLLELEWVLRSTYRFGRREILSALRAVVSIDNAEVEEVAAVSQALDWYEGGMDFADGLHIASAGRLHKFASFDAALRRTALRLGAAEVISL